MQPSATSCNSGTEIDAIEKGGVNQDKMNGYDRVFTLLGYLALTLMNSFPRVGGNSSRIVHNVCTFQISDSELRYFFVRRSILFSSATTLVDAIIVVVHRRRAPKPQSRRAPD